MPKAIVGQFLYPFRRDDPVVSQFENSHRDQVLSPAGTADHGVVGVIDRRDGAKTRSSFVTDPATGTLVLRPDLGLKLEKTLRREARHLAFRLYLQLLPLYFLQLQLKCRYSMLRVGRSVFGFFR